MIEITHDMTGRQAAAVLIDAAIRAGRTPDLHSIATITGLPPAEVGELRDLIVSGNKGSLDGLPLAVAPMPPRQATPRHQCPDCGTSVIVLSRHRRDVHGQAPQ